MNEPIHPTGNGNGPQAVYWDQPRLVGPTIAKQDQFITFGLVIRAVRRWWKAAAPLGLLLAASAGIAIYLLFEPTYEASAWLEILDRPFSLAFPSQFDSAKFVQTQVEIIRSPLVLSSVVSRPEIAQLDEFQRVRGTASPTDYLAKKIRVKSVGNSELYTITWEGPDPQDDAAIVNAVVKSYMELRKRQEAARVQRVIELVKQERDRHEKEVEALQERVRKLTKEVTGKDPWAAKPDEKTSNVIHQITALQMRLTESEVQRVFLEAEVGAYEQPLPQAEISEAETEASIAAHPEVRERTTQLAQQKAVLREIETRMDDPTKQPQYRSKLAALREQEATRQRLMEELRKQVKAELQQKRLAQGQDRLKGLKADLKSAQRTEEVLKKRVEEARRNFTEHATSSVELAFLQADLKRGEDVFERIASRLVALQTEQRAPERVNLLREAEVPTTPVVAAPYKQIGLAGAACFILPFVLAVFLEKLRQRISESSQIKEQFQLSLIREIARLPLGAHSLQRNASRRLRQDVEMFQESIDSLRVSLVTSESFQGAQMLAVTSAANNEGKTSVAVQLAVSLARASGEKTLIIDGDMRSPDVHNLLGIAAGPGLANLLAKEITLEDGPIISWASHVDVLPAGKAKRSPHRLLGNGDLDELLGQLRQRYRYIVIDTPPVLAASESVMLSRAADGCLLVTMRNVSRMDQVAETYARLLAAGARPVGVALNGVPIPQYRYYYGHYEADRDAADTPSEG
jgi:capsular exopolysaccharide synthesis family protein